LKKILADKRVSLFTHLLMAVSVMPFLIFYTKHETLMVINGFYSPAGDMLMYHITRLPELAMIVFVVVLSLFFERRVFLATVIAMSVCGLSILLFKHVLFSDYTRPFQWLDANHIRFHAVSGIRLHANGSFPSGHTMSAFCALALAGFISKRGSVQFLLFLLACASAYSRVYVAQHFLMDVYAGGLIGYSFAFFFYNLFQSRFTTPYWQQSFIRRKS
jgi:membrane-associated phospholipid phosphatase